MPLLKCNYHTHNRLCNHATGDVDDYVKKAIELGMEEIGLSDHAPTPTSFMSYEEFMKNLCYRSMSVDVFENIYLKALDASLKKYAGKIRILRGIEAEYLPQHHDFYASLGEKLDYMLLGIHFFPSNGRILNSYDQIDYTNVLDYAKTACQGMESGLYSILVHPDLFMFGYRNVDGKRRFDENAIKATRMIIECAIKNNIYLELNCNGLANSVKYNSTEWLYPYKEFWEIAREYPEVKVIIGVDAHRPDALESEDIKKVIDFAKGIGLKVEEKVSL